MAGTLAVTALTAMVLLTACATNQQVASQTQETAPTPTLLSQPPPTPLTLASLPHPSPTPRPTPTTTTTLTLWTSEQEEALHLVRTLADEFGKQHDLVIEVVSKHTDSLRIDMIARQLAGEPHPDMIWGTHDDLAQLLHDQQIQPVGTLDGAGAFLPATVTGATYNGQLWGYPIAAQGFLFLLYNQAALTQPPQTTDELIVQARAIHRTPYHPDTTESAEATTQETQETQEWYGMVAGWSEARWLLAWLNGFGGSVTTADGTQPDLNTSAMSNTLYLLRELYATAPPDQLDYADGHTIFLAGQVALAIDGDWALAEYRSLSPTLKVGIAPMPEIPSTGRIAAPALGATYLMLHRQVQHDTLVHARAFARFLETPTTQIRIASGLQRLPALRTALAAPEITSDRVLAIAAQQAEAAIGLPPTRGFRCALGALNVYLPILLAPDSNGTHAMASDQATLIEAMHQHARQCMIE